MSPPDAEVPYGTLHLMVLKTLAVLGPRHGHGVARRIEQVAERDLVINQARLVQLERVPPFRRLVSYALWGGQSQ
jgi:hypothetical protein